jgi:hypothetical protein
MDFYEAYVRPDSRRARSKHNTFASRPHAGLARERAFGDFTCRHCQRPVSADPARSRVNHRNHCPYCLWSRHVDLAEAGDRLAACKAEMEPVGLAFKRRHKKYAGDQPGELMLVHRCTGCGTLSINRIAADDGPAALRAVYETSLAQAPTWQGDAQAAGIDLLDESDRGRVQSAGLGSDW